MKKICFIILALITILFCSYALATGTYGVDLTADSYSTINPYPHSTYNCTAYAWGRANEKLGISLGIWGDAGNWYNNAINAGYTVDSTPQIGRAQV